MTDHRKTAVYIRLSAEDDNVDGRSKKESDSVTSQRILLKSFVIDQLGVAEADILEYVEMYLATLIQYAGIKLHKNALNKGFRTFAVYGSLYFFAYLAVGY